MCLCVQSSAPTEQQILKQKNEENSRAHRKWNMSQQNMRFEAEQVNKVQSRMRRRTSEVRSEELEYG